MRKHVAVYLNEAEYKALEDRAKTEERSISTTAKRIIKNSLNTET
jgi:PHD/YefM family antitoxin component YafN of YafNO toxin-antitoxin module